MGNLRLVRLLIFLTIASASIPWIGGQYIDAEEGEGDLGLLKRAWNSGFTSGIGKRAAWKQDFLYGLGKRAWNSGFTSGMGKRAWNSGFTSGMGKRDEKRSKINNLDYV